MGVTRLSERANMGRWQREVSVAAGVSEFFILPDSYKSCNIDIVPTDTTFMLRTTAHLIEKVTAGTATWFPAYDADQSAAVEEALELGIPAIRVDNTGAGTLVVCISGN